MLLEYPRSFPNLVIPPRVLEVFSDRCEYFHFVEINETENYMARAAKLWNLSSHSDLLTPSPLFLLCSHVYNKML